MPRLRKFGLWLLLGTLASGWWFIPITLAQDSSRSQWYKGNLHTHSLWSDGDDFPEMIGDWYRQHDYHFLALTDHNVLGTEVRWMKQSEIVRRGGPEVLNKYVAKFGRQWVQERGEPGTEQHEVALRPLVEFRSQLEQDGRFLLIPGEEISDAVGRLPIHLNATNVTEVLAPARGETVREAIANNVRAVAEQARSSGRQILVHLNHPNFGWAITPEDLAFVAEERFFEIYNGHPAVNQEGDELRPGLELFWDIANTLRIDRFASPPLFGLGTDDSHNYHGIRGATPGRGWIVVRAEKLEAEQLLTAIHSGDFYASSGVVLRDVRFDRESNELKLEIEPQPGVEFTTQFVGTPVDYDRTWPAATDAEGRTLSVKERYCPKIGTVFKSEGGPSPSYRLSGNELYVRAIVTSTRPHPNPSLANQFEQAWTQPVGWERRLDPR
ncbi:MAG: hypothetical protein JNL67_10400 [Planctomycetaceae bacterium]|nr:hypothetical protein [Planctomycetaceae bacterium]